jgi:predicted enzyme related to lactoylglutathione lyase
MTYRVVETGGAGGINGGIMKPQAGPWPGKMTMYLDVDDIEAYRERIVKGGGRMVVDKTDVPGVGQMALFEDPDGRVLGLWKRAT